ncbi:MAG: M28 family peptidase [Bacteroidales bacterium]|nr:M28 family peptidase [Bacteroidales bacterium]
MKKALLFLIALLMIQSGFSRKLIWIDCEEPSDLQKMAEDQGMTVHYMSENFVIASVLDDFKGDFKLLDENAWVNGIHYYVSAFNKRVEADYTASLDAEVEILLTYKDFLVLKTSGNVIVNPPVDGSLIALKKAGIRLPERSFSHQKGSLLADPEIIAMMEDVDTVLYLTNLQHLQDYGTRNAYTPQAVQAQNWIKQQFESYGYPVALFDFPMPGGAASDNVIATKTGAKYPDEYVVIGAHYDSYSFSGAAPGADDNGTGTCGVMEVARVMSQYDFDRTILFCAWSGEEYGLYGSEAYAEWASGQGINILGYFNIDMCGYRHPGDDIHTDVIAPAFAQPLVAFYMDVCSVYLPDFGVFQGALSGGDSDHTSFNNNGYMGIFPFEDSQNYSPYIHSPDDIIGTSVNSLEMALNFTRAMVASVATMANWLAPPQNLTAIPGDETVELSWDAMPDIDYYNVYRNNETAPYGSTTDPFFIDSAVENFVTYTYYVTAIYSGSGDESNPSNTVEITLLPPMAFPFTDDFESGALYWSFEGTWGLSTAQYHSAGHSITESPTGNYGNNKDMSAVLYAFSLENATAASFSFWTKYALEEGYDYTYLQISTNGTSWVTLDTYNGSQSSWIQKSFPLGNYLGEPFVQIRFKFESDVYVAEDGLYIDDFEIFAVIPGVGMADLPEVANRFSCFPNPASGQVVFNFEADESGYYEIQIFNAGGEPVETIRGFAVAGKQSVRADLNRLPAGPYFSRIILSNKTEITKVLISR